MSEIRLSASIMAVPERMDHVEYMLKELGKDASTVKYVNVFVDEFRMGIWFNAQQAWRSFDPDATHHIVLQDDLLICRDFFASVEDALTHIPEGDFMSLLGTSEFQKRVFLSGESSWFKSNAFNGTAVVAPTDVIDRMLDWANRATNPAVEGDDFRLWMWLIKAGRWCWHTVPCLAEHAGAYASTRKGVKGKAFGRELTSRGCFVGEDISASYIDWTKGLENPPVYPRRLPKPDHEAWAFPGARDIPA